jgi:hypothetical protein
MRFAQRCDRLDDYTHAVTYSISEFCRRARGAVFSALAPAAPHSILGPATSPRVKNPMVRMAQ